MYFANAAVFCTPYVLILAAWDAALSPTHRSRPSSGAQCATNRGTKGTALSENTLGVQSTNATVATETTTFAILVSLSVCHLLNDMNQSLVPALYPVLKHNYHLDFGQIGLITLAFPSLPPRCCNPWSEW